MSLRAGRSHRRAGSRVRAALWVLLLVAAFATSASAKTLSRIIPGLYGGQGIILKNPLNDHDPRFTSGSDPFVNQLNRAIQQAAGDLGAFGSAASTFTFDAEQAVFVSSQVSLGPVLAERAETIGIGQFQFGMSYTQRRFQKFDGESLKSLDLTLNHVDLCSSGSAFWAPGASPSKCTGQELTTIRNNGGTPDGPGPGGAGIPSRFNPNFEREQILLNLDTELHQDIITWFFNLGVAENVDVGLVVPFIHTFLQVHSAATIVRNAGTIPGGGVHDFCLPTDLNPSTGCIGTTGGARTFATNANPNVAGDIESGSDWGFGDLELRSKAHLVKSDALLPDVALLGRLRLKTGQDENFRGTGHLGYGAFVILSKVFLGFLTPHINAGVDFSSGSNADKAMARSAVRYIVGADARLHQRVTASAEFIGRTGLGSSDKAFIKRRDLFDFGFGVKVHAAGALNFVANVLIPINRNRGLRTDATWTVGGELTF